MRGVLSVAVLAVLARGTRHGYAVASELADAGLGEVKGGTLYPLLARLESAGWIAAEWQPGDGGPGRKVYALTPAGRDYAADQACRWTRFTSLTNALIHGSTTARSTS
ncbi:MAG: PadR family transcriptional regulator [Actinomycetales bacterium]|nr:MAG: PadR family transcriptional regulator [Actinomycetales bacterium]